MASSSHSNQSFKNCDDTKESNIIEEKVSKARQEEEEEEDWLQLGLGLGPRRKRLGHKSNPGSNPPSSPSPSSQVPNNLQIGLGLGLGLRLEWRSSSGLGPNDAEGCMEVASDYGKNLLGWSNLNAKVPSWQMDSQDWYMPVPAGDSHHYCDRSPHESGLWFTLLSSTNRKGEALPQLPKAYIRVKNENMSIFMVKKYLVRKLGLSNEAEIDILCMGEILLDMQSLRQVRDSVWLPGLVGSLNSASKSFGDSHDHGKSTSHLMPLLYQKYCTSLK